MLHVKPIRESLSFKQNEKHLLDSRDALCQHYRLNKSDLVKYLIKKESFNLKNPQGTFLWLSKRSSLTNTTYQRKESSSRSLGSPTRHPKITNVYLMHLYRKHMKAVKARESNSNKKNRIDDFVPSNSRLNSRHQLSDDSTEAVISKHVLYDFRQNPHQHWLYSSFCYT